MVSLHSCYSRTLARDPNYPYAYHSRVYFNLSRTVLRRGGSGQQIKTAATVLHPDPTIPMSPMRERSGYPRGQDDERHKMTMICCLPHQQLRLPAGCTRVFLCDPPRHRFFLVDRIDPLRHFFFNFKKYQPLRWSFF